MKLKKALMLSMLALGAVGVASCGKTEDSGNDGVTQTQKYTVTYNANGHGTAPASVADVTALPGTLPEITSNDGYTFVGWYLDAACTQAATPGATITGNTTLYAKWNAPAAEEKYTVTYNANGHGTAPASAVDVTALPATLPTIASDEDFTFIGWYLDAACTQAATAGAAITANTTLYAKWEAVVKYTITFDVQGVGEAINSIEESKIKGLPVPTVAGKLFNGWYTDNACTTLATEGTALTGPVTLYAGWTDNANVDKEATEAVEIATVDDFLAFRALTGEAAITTNYKLTADIDLSGVTLDASSIEFAGVFDGNGHTIMNANYEGAASKSGILVAKLVNGGIIKNVKFLGCSVTSTNESAAVVAGEINGGGYVKDVEINSCTVSSTGNYGALIYGRSESSAGKEVLLEGITVKNGSSVACGQYGGLITGDNTANVTLINSQIEAQFSKSSNNWGLLLGRTRNDAQVYRVENVIANVSYSGSVGSSTGLICQGKNKCSVVAKNFLVLNSNAKFAGANGKVTADNVYYLNDSAIAATMPSMKNIEAVDEATINSTWYKETLLDNFDEVWEVESNGGIKLKSASKNTVDDTDVLQSLILSTGNVKTRFKKGEEFDATGLLVRAKYESGVQIVLTADKYDVISTDYKSDTAGTYTITVQAKNSSVTQTYEVTVVEQTGFTIDDEFVNHTYVAGTDFDAAGLIVYGTWSDGVTEKLASTEYTINSNNFNKDAAGTYEIVVNSGNFTEQKFSVTVIASAATVVDEVVTVSVDASYTGVNGAEVDGVQTFKSITEALNYLTLSKLDNSVKKVINIKDGEYREKITISLNNVEFVGESREGTKIVYDAVESTINPITGAQYVLNCATVHVNASGFTAKNISIYNDFDYKNNQYNPAYADVKESSPQGLALTLNGDMFILDNCHLYGNQDTLYLKSGRTYVKGGIVEGNIDFIFGEAKGIAFFDGTTINAVAKGLTADQMKNNGYVTAFKGEDGNKPNYGVVFSGCDFTADADVPNGSMSLGRPWGKRATVAYINCSFSAAYSTAAYDGSTKSRWFDMSGNKPQDADFVEYGSTGAGAITTAVTGGSVLTTEQAANYTMANTFAKNNGNIVWTVDWDPSSSEAVVDKSTYYMFNGQSNSTGTSYTYDQNINGTTAEWNGLSIDGTKGKVSARTSDTQINAGGKISFEVAANSTVTVETYPGYHDYTLNGVATSSDTFSQFYATTTTVTFEAVSTVYLYKIVITPEQEAPAAATVESLTVKGTPSTALSTGTELDLSELVVKANMSDSSIKTLSSSEYSVDTSAVNKDAAGTYSVKVTYGGAEASFNVEYVEGEVDTTISAPLILDFKGGTFSTLIEDTGVTYVKKGDIDASTKEQIVNNVTFRNCKANGTDNWLKVDSTTEITFKVSGPCTVYVTTYDSNTVPSVSLGTNNVTGTNEVFSGNIVKYSFVISEAGTVTITFAGQYVGAIAIGGF